MPNHELAERLHKAIIKKFEKRKVYSSFKDNIWGVDLMDMQLISELYKIFYFLLCHMDSYSKYAWAASLKDNKSFTTINAFQKHFTLSNCKPNKNMGDKSSGFYNRSLKPWL